jgi:hypothetical protein
VPESESVLILIAKDPSKIKIFITARILRIDGKDFRFISYMGLMTGLSRNYQLYQVQVKGLWGRRGSGRVTSIVGQWERSVFGIECINNTVKGVSELSNEEYLSQLRVEGISSCVEAELSCSLWYFDQGDHFAKACLWIHQMAPAWTHGAILLKDKLG